MNCLKATIGAITPECFTPAPEKSSILLNRISYHECPIATTCAVNQVEQTCCIVKRESNPNGLESYLVGEEDDVESQEEIEIPIPSEVSECIESFASYCHDQWVYNKVSFGEKRNTLVY